MTTRVKGILITGAALLALGGGGAAIADAAGGEGEEREDGGSEAAEQVRDPASAARAERPALEAVGGGKVSEVERGDDGQSGYEVEIDRRDGSSVEVNVDPNSKIVSVAKDD
jgi:uncharacterized membrane protein YkoI